jgi:hypothetical protein
LAEANRRRVFRTTGVYIVAVWGISSGGVDIAGVLGIPESALRIGILAAVAFLPVVVLLAWRFDIGRRGIVRDEQDVTARKQVEDAMAEMPTMMISGEDGAGAVVVRWSDEEGEENAALFTEPFFLGRGTECRVRFYDPLVSRQHARIFSEEDEWFIEDLGSRNGTLLGGRSVERAALETTSDVRVNEAGPTLRVEIVKPGAETRTLMSAFPAGASTAHVRIASLDGVGGADEAHRS